MAELKQQVERVIESNDEWLERFARFGFFTKGVVYCLLGTMTTLSAFRFGGEKASRDDVFQKIYEQPFGKILLAATALGLFAYAVWRLYEATKNPASKKAIVRLGYAGSGLLYGSMGVSAVLLATTGGGGSNGGGTQSAVAEALQQPFGKIIVGIAALVVIGKAFYQFYRAFTGNLDSGLYLPKNQSKLVFRAAVFGFAARGVVLAVVGYFFVRAALHENSGEARDTKGVFTFLESGFGPWLLGIVAFGLVCYGVFMMVRARYGSFEVQ